LRPGNQYKIGIVEPTRTKQSLVKLDMEQARSGRDRRGWAHSLPRDIWE